ncbi:carbohydrate ABC transporter permease [Cohnella fermenti]|uniref:Carbohydrate ABC transporter permease n=1 Tax=Cohnella fermenti TaxID=2565925 RepID=A0A4V3WEV3_9BACL|nr:carbohydrate ABC transporter permease [Cohnella fermenti]THF77808.1 carbohydrate ABC transporter permease [Cohnella fermenti]
MIRKWNLGLVYLVILVFSLFCFLPFLLVLSSSFTSEESIIAHGYNLIPHVFDTSAYHLLFLDGERILNGYKISIIVTVGGTVASLAVTSLLAYPLALKRLKLRKALNLYTLITILINGGIVPWYIVCVRYLHLQDNLFALIVPYLCQAWNVFLLRSFFQTIPDEISESAKMDGAGEYRIFCTIIAPLAKPALATVGLFIALMYWNDWWLGLTLLNRTELQPLQLLLRTIQSNVQFISTSAQGAEIIRATGGRLPSEGIKMAVCILTIGPIVFVYPFVQRFFIKGLTIGAVKG